MMGTPEIDPARLSADLGGNWHRSYAEPHLRGPEMYKHCKLVCTVNAWVIMGCKVARGVSEAAWVVLGGCPDYLSPYASMRGFIGLTATSLTACAAFATTAKNRTRPQAARTGKVFRQSDQIDGVSDTVTCFGQEFPRY
jgi:hypothetical protein